MTTFDPGAVDALLARARRDVEEGVLPACQLALALDGEALVQEAFGAADVDTRSTVLSATKPSVAGGDGRSNVRGMGRTVSPASFGHSGAAGHIAWADPATGLSCCYLTDGRDLHLLREHWRTTALASLAAVCVG